jgi:hypothetical protein
MSEEEKERVEEATEGVGLRALSGERGEVAMKPGPV